MIKRILFISPRIALQKGDFLGSGIPYWPLEMAITAAFARDKGHVVDVIDLFGASPKTLQDFGDHYMQGEPLQKSMNRIRSFEADLIVIYGLSYMSHSEICRILQQLKQMNLSAKLAVLENSQAVTAFALPSVQDSLFQAGADALICGEAYWNWDELLQDIENSNSEATNLLLKEFPQKKIERKIKMDGEYPVPAWDLFDLKNYWSLPYAHGPKTKKFFPIYTSRGCPYPCDFCVVPGTNSQKWRGRKAQDVVGEIETLRDQYQVFDFQIEDLNPTINWGRMDEICDLLIRKNLGIRFYIVSGTKAETIKVEQLEKYQKAGCRYISISPESGSAAVMKAIGKPFNYEHGLRLIEKAHQLGIATQACFIVGHPAETDEDFVKSKQYLRSLIHAGLTEAAIFIVAPFAGSKLAGKDSIAIDHEQLISFSPKGRSDYQVLEHRRSEMIRTFFIEKLKHGEIWMQGLRVLFGTPRTKMENLPKRIVYVMWLIMRFRFHQALGLAGANR